MRDPIETSRSEGEVFVSEDHIPVSNELAPKSTQDVAIKESDRECELAAAHLHVINRAKQLAEKGGSGAISETNSGISAIPAKAALPTATCSDAQGQPKPDVAGAANRVPTKRRVAALCGATMVAASLTCMYFRPDFSAYAARYNGRTSEVVAPSFPSTGVVSPRKVGLESDDIALQDQTVGVVPVRGTQIAVASATQSSDSFEPTRRVNALETELRATREALAQAQESKLRSMKAAQDAAAALQESLAKIALLEIKLEQASRHIEQGAPSRSRRLSQRRADFNSQPGFFGLFNAAANQPVQRRHARRR